MTDDDLAVLETLAAQAAAVAPRPWDWLEQWTVAVRPPVVARYVRAAAAALPRLVAEVRRLRADLARMACDALAADGQAADAYAAQLKAEGALRALVAADAAVDAAWERLTDHSGHDDVRAAETAERAAWDAARALVAGTREGGG